MHRFPSVSGSQIHAMLFPGGKGAQLYVDAKGFRGVAVAAVDDGRVARLMG